MSVQAVFVLGVSVTAGAAILTTAYLRRPMQAILVDLCGNQKRAEFWTAFSLVAIVLAPTIFALAYIPENSELPVFAVGSQLKWGLTGLLAALVIIGGVLSRFISRNAFPAAGPAPLNRDEA